MANNGVKDRSSAYQTLNTKGFDDEVGTDMFERADYDDVRRPESARYQPRGRSSLLGNINKAALFNNAQTHYVPEG